MKYLFVIIVLAILCGCKKYEANEGSGEKTFTLSLADTAGVRANGISSVTIRLATTADVKPGLKVVFSTNKGTILAAEQPLVNKQVETKLLLSMDTGVYVIKAVVKEGDAIKLEKLIYASFRPAYNTEDFTFAVSDTAGVRLNGISMISLKFTGTVTNDQSLRVYFTSNKGTLQQADMPYLNGTSGTSMTVGQDTGAFIIKAQLKKGSDIMAEKLISFNLRRANVNSIVLELNRSSWNTSNHLVIKTLLLRNNGYVSTGQQAFFSAYQLGPASEIIPVGRFEGLLNNTTNAQGLLSDVKLFTELPGMDISKPVNIVVKSLNDQGDTVRQTVTLPYQ